MHRSDHFFAFLPAMGYERPTLRATPSIDDASTGFLFDSRCQPNPFLGSSSSTPKFEEALWVDCCVWNVNFLTDILCKKPISTSGGSCSAFSRVIQSYCVPCSWQRKIRSYENLSQALISLFLLVSSLYHQCSPNCYECDNDNILHYYF